MWGSWSEPLGTDCRSPATRTRTRTCVVNANAVTQNVTRTFPCSTICTTGDTDTGEDEVLLERCEPGNFNNGGNTAGGKIVA